MKSTKKTDVSPQTAYWLHEPNETIRRVKILVTKYEDLIHELMRGTERQKALAQVFGRVVRDLRTALEEPKFDLSEVWQCPKCGEAGEPTTDGGCTSCSKARVRQ